MTKIVPKKITWRKTSEGHYSGRVGGRVLFRIKPNPVHKYVMKSELCWTYLTFGGTITGLKKCAEIILTDLVKLTAKLEK